MLHIVNINAGYVKGHYILRGISLSVLQKEIIGIVGQNGSGKSTLAKTIMGLVPFVEGDIIFEGVSLNRKNTNEISAMGISFFLQGGRVFPDLTIEENMEIAAYRVRKKYRKKYCGDSKEYFELFRNRNEKLKASYLSGGEKQQLALAMVLLKKPKLLILDEPSAGLSPKNIQIIYGALNNYIKNTNSMILLIEQNVKVAFEYSKRIVLLDTGRVFIEQTSNKGTEEKVLEKFFFKE